MRQGNDTGTQYRSAIYYHSPQQQQKSAEASREAYQKVLKVAGYGHITTELASAGPFYFAEGYHQQREPSCCPATVDPPSKRPWPRPTPTGARSPTSGSTDSHGSL